MIVNGYAKTYKYAGDGTLLIQVRIPSIHGPYTEAGYQGKQVRNFTKDENLPFYPSLLLPHLPNEGEVVALTSIDERTTEFMVIGLTGGSYYTGSNLSID
jgi:hypothetical protein